MALGFWAKDYLGPKEAGGGGGDNDFVVTITKEDSSFSADKTYTEIMAAAMAGKLVRAVRIDETNNHATFYWLSSASEYGAYFSNTAHGSTAIGDNLYITTEDAVYVTEWNWDETSAD